MNKPIRTTTPNGQEIVIVAASEFDRLVELAEDAVDVREAEAALAEARAGKVELLTQADVVALLDAPSPVAFWRKRRSLTQSALAKRTDISQAYLAQIEAGKRKGDVGLYQRLARSLKVGVEDLLPPVEKSPKPKVPGRKKGAARRKTS